METDLVEWLMARFPFRVVDASRGFSSFLTFDVEEVNDETNKGHLWIYLSSWEVGCSGTAVISSDCDPADEGWTVLQQFKSAKLVSLDQDDETFTFLFSNGMTLKIWPDFDFYDRDDELFMFFVAGYVVCYSPEGGWVAERSQDVKGNSQ